MPDPSNLDRAADIIEYESDVLTAAEALAKAGLLVTDEIQAVLDAAVSFAVWAESAEWVGKAADDLSTTVDAYLATRGPA